MASSPHHGDGYEYEGECLCHGVVRRGPIARSRPTPYLTSSEPLGPATTKAILIVSETGAHDLVLAEARRV